MKISLRLQYILLFAILHIALLLLAFIWLDSNKPLFIASEILVIISIGFTVKIYTDFMRPVEFIRSGVEALKDKDFTVKFIPTGKNEIDVIIEVYNLMIDQLRLERTKLNEQHYFFQKLIEASPIAVLILDFDGKITSVNAETLRLFDREASSFEGHKPGELNIPLFGELQDMKDGESRTVKTNGIETYKIRRSNFMDRGFPRSFFMIEELTTEILKSEKNAYGKVIRMMAHEVNNTLGAVDSILQTTRKELAENEPSELTDALQIASERNQRLNRFMQNFADIVRLPVPEKASTDINKLLKGTGTLMKRSAAKHNISMELIIPEQPHQIPLDAAQVEQVFVNVIKNAIEACSEGDKIQLIAEENHIIIRNNGKPLSSETENQLFNPFFSTKSDGQGIGLTLSREILLNHGFTFSLKSDPNGWTEFIIEWV